ncbi:hypothetical protein H6F90_12765 [Trichocoleus sp. FACHB-591]|uniref:hypothetical protein n=1 Tax=Trichocoleus sp. FACHB-591 TaxID=2692872 RepID=UPI0016842DAE|nr:hypothetical protein [Trichocoleus sp. FACHB-591]MBD2096017.1 hypothetical protein [Trichocoleus sp. FACHB-591]
MKPQFQDQVAWTQAELLMQPAFIRLLDNIRKQLDQSDWKGTYQDVQTWPEGTPEAIQAQVKQLQAELATASPEQAAEIEQALAHLPTPFPGYLLCLEKQGQQVQIDLWELCYQVCFRNYQVLQAISDPQAVEIDTSLIDDEMGEVDWNRLDDKARQLIEQVFSNLPSR